MMARSFSRVLEELGSAEEDGDGTLAEPQFKVSAGVGLMVTALGPQRNSGSLRKSAQYEEMHEEPEPLPQLSLPELESQIGGATTMEELRRLRRQFARSSHPDRSEDASATSEMAAANRLIDDAIAALRERREER